MKIHNFIKGINEISTGNITITSANVKKTNNDNIILIFTAGNDLEYNLKRSQYDLLSSLERSYQSINVFAYDLNRNAVDKNYLIQFSKFSISQNVTNIIPFRVSNGCECDPECDFFYTSSSGLKFMRYAVSNQWEEHVIKEKRVYGKVEIQDNYVIGLDMSITVDVIDLEGHGERRMRFGDNFIFDFACRGDCMLVSTEDKAIRRLDFRE